MAAFPDLPSSQWGALVTPVKQTSAALSSSTAAVGQLTGAPLVIMWNTGATPGTYTTRTNAQMIADAELQPGYSWLIILGNNQGTGTLTLGAGSGVTVSGTATVGTQVARLFLASVSSASVITITGLAFSWTIAV